MIALMPTRECECALFDCVWAILCLSLGHLLDWIWMCDVDLWSVIMVAEIEKPQFDLHQDVDTPGSLQ